MFEETAREAARRFCVLAEEKGFSVDEQKQARFMLYAQRLLEWNEKINLTRITDAEGIASLHFLDSILPLEQAEIFKNGSKVIDVGTGAGFPGLPMKIMRPDLDLTLNDALNKRLKVLQSITDELQLSGVHFVHGRAEEIARQKQHRDAYDIVTARAVAALPTLSELLLPFCKTGGTMLALKGEAREEIAAAKNAIGKLGGEFCRVCEVPVAGGENHSIVICRKVRPTPKEFPRKPGEAGRNPL